jgi:hypothetical protein
MKTSAKNNMSLPRKSPRRKHRYQWIIDLLSDEASFFQKPMFGCEACYLHGRLVMVLAGSDREPWRGALVPTERSHHSSLRHEFKFLKVHPILGKWLYLPESSEAFESGAEALIERIQAKDSRMGVESGRSS